VRPTKESGKILNDYVKLAKKLNKLPTRTDLENNSFISERQIRKYFNNLTNLKNLALKLLPKFINTKTVISIQKEAIYKVLGVNSEK